MYFGVRKWLKLTFLDSPKLPNKQNLKSKTSTPKKISIPQKSMKKTSAHSIVVVNKPIIPGPNDKDPEILRLQVGINIIKALLTV